MAPKIQDRWARLLFGLTIYLFRGLLDFLLWVVLCSVGSNTLLIPHTFHSSSKNPSIYFLF